MHLEVTPVNGIPFTLAADQITEVEDLTNDAGKVVGSTLLLRGTDEVYEVEETRTEINKTLGTKVVRSGAMVK